MKPSLVGLRLDMSFEGVCVNEIFIAVDTIKLAKSGLLIIDLLRQELVDFILSLEGSVNLI